MAWEWSHTAEAYRNAELNLQDLDPAELRIIWAEWKAYDPHEFTGSKFNHHKYPQALLDASPLGPVRLASDIWRWASEQATCDNGGFNAWVCPFGCGCHKVPFDRDVS